MSPSDPLLKSRLSGLSGVTIKMIACGSMLLDHLAKIVLIHIPQADIPVGPFPISICGILSAVGRMAFPLFAFLLAEGFRHTGNRTRYMVTVFLFGLLSEIPYDIAFYGTPLTWTGQNVMFTFSLGLAAMHLISICSRQWLRYVVWVPLALLAQVARLDYGFIGVAFAVFCYLERSGMLATVFAVSSGTVSPWSILAAPLMVGYNGHRGRLSKGMKYIFYVFYPVHLAVLYLIRTFIS